MKHKEHPDQVALNRSLIYKNGDLIRRPRARSNFESDADFRRWNSRFANKLAGSLRQNGYVYVKLDGERFMAHRLIWILHNGEIPKGMVIDHINHNRADNRIQNLRVVDASGNSSNARRGTRNTSGVVGVTTSSSVGKWKAQISKHGKYKCLGSFETKEEAAAVRKQAEISLGFHPNHGKN